MMPAGKLQTDRERPEASLVQLSFVLESPFYRQSVQWAAPVVDFDLPGEGRSHMFLRQYI